MIKFESLNHFPNVYFVSDLHLSHRNITRGVSGWKPIEDNPSSWRQDTFKESMEDFYRSTRDFETVDEMNQTIIDNINEYVNEDDLLIDCGDWNFAGKDNHCRDRLNVRTIYSCIGNHDHVDLKENRGIFSRKEHIFYFQYKGQKFMCCHYPFLYSFHQSHKGAWCIHGHVHGSQEGKFPGKIMDVGIDNTFNRLGKYRPLSFEEVGNYMTKKNIVFESHHNENTN